MTTKTGTPKAKTVRAVSKGTGIKSLTVIEEKQGADRKASAKAVRRKVHAAPRRGILRLQIIEEAVNSVLRSSR